MLGSYPGWKTALTSDERHETQPAVFARKYLNRSYIHTGRTSVTSSQAEKRWFYDVGLGTQLPENTGNDVSIQINRTLRAPSTGLSTTALTEGRISRMSVRKTERAMTRIRSGPLSTLIRQTSWPILPARSSKKTSESIVALSRSPRLGETLGYAFGCRSAVRLLRTRLQCGGIAS